MEMDRQMVYRLYTDKSIVSFYIGVEPNGKPTMVLGGVWGYIEVEPVHTSNKNSCFWDNLDFFLKGDFEEIKKECKQELKDKELHSKGFFKDFKGFLKVVREEVKKDYKQELKDKGLYSKGFFKKFLKVVREKVKNLKQIWQRKQIR